MAQWFEQLLVGWRAWVQSQLFPNIFFFLKVIGEKLRSSQTRINCHHSTQMEIKIYIDCTAWSENRLY